MSLINDALKTAQRERAGRAPTASGGQPLLEGFFPFVSTSAPAGRSRRTRLIGISLSALALLVVVGWLTVPRIKRGLGGPSAKSLIVLPPLSQDVENPATPSVTVPVTDTQRAVTAAVDSAPAPANVSEPPLRPVGRSTQRSTAGDAREVVRSADLGSARGDTAIARPGVLISQAPVTPPRDDRPASSRIDYEARATALFNAGDFHGARENFQLATRFAPTARAWTNYGVTLQKLGELTAATSAYQAAIGIDANYLEPWLYQGRIAVQRGETQRAVPLFQRARSINPRHSEVNTELAELEVNAKNWTEARRFAEDGVRGDPANSRAHWFLAVATDQLNDFVIAAREYAAYLQTVGAAEKDNLQNVGYARMRLEQIKGKP